MRRKRNWRSQRPVTFTFGVQPEQKYVTDALERVNAEGLKITGQVLPRPVGMIFGHAVSWNPFSFCPSYQAIASLPVPERLNRLRDPDLRARLIAEEPELKVPLARHTRRFEAMYPFVGRPNYEPTEAEGLMALAARAGVTPMEAAYDHLLSAGGTGMLYVALGNLKDHSLDAVGELMHHPNFVMGLGDGGAHYGLICDATYPTYLLTHWGRDRDHGQVDLPWAIAALARRPAEVVGLHDRGLLKPGYKADINVIDHGALTLKGITINKDLPGGGQRLMQDAHGYRATIVSGEVTYRDGKPTGNLPGRFVRGAQAAP
jgi:N-acyl-D-amino-acid deacylase